MNNTDKENWLQEIAREAQEGGHVWPEYAACEGALESNFGRSELAQIGNNLFGMKVHSHTEYGQFGEIILPTKEIINGEQVIKNAYFISYPRLADCFTDRMKTLQRLRFAYPHYNNALNAQDGETFIREVSANWSTDPDRADKVLNVYREFFRS